MIHGTRGTYQRVGCRCTPCKAAEASYRAELRRRHAQGRPILGSPVDASQAIKMVKAMAVEGLTERELAWHLGLKEARVRWQTTRIRVRSLLKLHRVYRLRML